MRLWMAAAVWAVLVPVSGASAQASPVAFGVLAGASIPLGDFSDGAGVGWHGGGLFEWHGPVLPIGIRADVVYHRFGSKDFSAGGVTTSATPSIIAGTLNALLSMPMNQTSTASPYLIGGVGVYNERASCDNCAGSGVTVSNSQTKFGLNGGVGVSFPLSGFSSMLEARFHYVLDSEVGSGNTMFVPISFGILFR
jgi:hypothetical protein